MRYSLSPSHYAAGWSTEETLTPEEITALGIRYHATAEGPAREELLLRILRSFHNYITKYADMIRRGHLPAYRSHQPTALRFRPPTFRGLCLYDPNTISPSVRRRRALIQSARALR